MPAMRPASVWVLVESLGKLVLFIAVLVLAYTWNEWLGRGLIVGWLAATWQRHPYRVWGLMPWGWFWLAAGILWRMLASTQAPADALMGAGLAGLTWPWLVTTWHDSGRMNPIDARRGVFLACMLLTTLGFKLVGDVLSDAYAPGIALVVALTFGTLTKILLLRPFLECGMELILLPVYRVRKLGPGAGKVPPNGPVIVVGNHSAFFDPCWIAKHLPRPVTPMMTSVYYDVPILKQLMVHVVRAIRVPWEPHRKSTPELDEAIARLKDGECILLFPEGGLRREDGQLLKYFAQGIWHILKAVPDTPVVCCWIDGGWGSYWSYGCGMPPGVGKPMDWWRCIRVVFAEPLTLSSELLATHHATRRFLTQRVFDLRKELPDLPPGQPPPQLLNGPAVSPNGD